MKHTWKKAAAGLLALTLATGSLPANTPLQDLFSWAVLTAHAEVTDSGECGENVTWSLEDGVLTIDGEGAITDYYDVPPWYSSRSDITEAVIKSGVTSIGNRAFINCSNLISVVIPDSVTSIGVSAFSTCHSLESVTIPNSVTSISDYTFYGCNLKSVTIPDSVTSIGKYAFMWCSSLESVKIPDNVTSIVEYAFSNCSSLESVTIPNSVTSIGDDTFYGCNLKSVTIPASVTSSGENAFRECTALKSVIVERAETLTALGSKAFHCWDDEAGCDVILPNVTIYVRETKAEEYKNVENWSDYADKIIDYSDTQLPDGKYKQTAQNGNTYYTRFVYAVPNSVLAGKSKVVFSFDYEGRTGIKPTVEKTEYYTGVTTNGVIFTPISADSVLLVVTVSSGRELDNLTCEYELE